MARQGAKSLISLFTACLILFVTYETRTDVPAGAVAALQTSSGAEPPRTLVTLHVTDAPGMGVYGEISRQSNLYIGPFSGRSWPELPNVTLDAERVFFWQVMHKLSEQTGLAPVPLDGKIYMDAAPLWAKAPWSCNGGVMFVADQASAGQNVSYTTQNQNQDSIFLYLRAYMDPKFDLLQVGTLVVSEATDENGKSLVSNRPGGFGIERGSLSGALHLGARLLYSPETGKRIVRLRGSFPFALCTRREAWEVNDMRVRKDAIHKTSLGTYILTSFESRGTDPPQYLLKAQFVGKTSFSSPLHNYEAIARSMRLIDAEGREYESAGVGEQREGRYEYMINFSFPDNPRQKLGPPARLIWNIPMEFKETAVSIELNDIPLPFFQNRK